MERGSSNEGSSSTSLINFLPEVVPVERNTRLPDPYLQPKKFYYCNLCGKESRSFQAMGGHMNAHKIERADLKERARKAAMLKERAQRAAIENTAKRIACLKQRAERIVLKRRADKASVKQLVHPFVSVGYPVPVIFNCQRRHFYSPRRPYLSESRSVHMFHVFLGSKFDEEYENKKKFGHDETAVKFGLTGNNRTSTHQQADVDLEMRLGNYNLDLELKLC